MSPGLSSFFWLIAVVAMIPLALWVLKRTPMGGAGSLGSAARTVGVTPLSASQRLVTVEVGVGEERQWLLLGVTANSISTLHCMKPPAGSVAAAAPQPLAGFAQVFSRLRQTAGRSDAP